MSDRDPVSALQQDAALAFAYSPLLEAVLSLHVLVEPKHDALQHRWVRAMRALPAPLRREVTELSVLYRWTLPNCVLAPQLRVEPDELSFRLDVPHEHEVAFDAAHPLLLVPSVFVWPHVRVNCDPPWPLRLLAATGILQTRREGYFLYSLADGQFDALAGDLRRVVGSATPRGGG